MLLSNGARFTIRVGPTAQAYVGTSALQRSPGASTHAMMAWRPSFVGCHWNGPNSTTAPGATTAFVVAPDVGACSSCQRFGGPGASSHRGGSGPGWRATKIRTVAGAGGRVAPG